MFVKCKNIMIRAGTVYILGLDLAGPISLLLSVSTSSKINILW